MKDAAAEKVGQAADAVSQKAAEVKDAVKSETESK